MKEELKRFKKALLKTLDIGFPSLFMPTWLYILSTRLGPALKEREEKMWEETAAPRQTDI